MPAAFRRFEQIESPLWHSMGSHLPVAGVHGKAARHDHHVRHENPWKRNYPPELLHEDSDRATKTVAPLA